jgi:hypothetical protein
MYAPDVNVIKRFFFVADEEARLDGVFVPAGEPFHPGLSFPDTAVGESAQRGSCLTAWFEKSCQGHTLWLIFSRLQ